jgi:hypothetical protein
MSRRSHNELQSFLADAIAYEGNDCLFWPFAKVSAGYGQIKWGRKRHLTHRVVCEAAHGPPPDGRPFAIHSCGKGEIGCITKKHLRWGSRADNAKDAKDHGDVARGERNGFSRLKEDDVRAILAASTNLTRRQISDKFGISYSHAGSIIRGDRWGWL